MKNNQLTNNEKEQLKDFLVISTKDERPKPESFREVVMYYFDWLFGEMTFLYGFIPLFKLGMVPHLALMIGALRIQSNVVLAIFIYLLGVIIVAMMKLLVMIIEKRH